MKRSMTIEQILKLSLQVAVDQSPPPPDAAWVRQHLTGSTVEPETEGEPWSYLSPEILRLALLPSLGEHLHPVAHAAAPLVVRNRRARFAVATLVVNGQAEPTENDVAAVEVLDAQMKERSLMLHIRMPDKQLDVGEMSLSLTMLAYPDRRLIDTFALSDSSPLSEHTLTTTLPLGLAESWPDLLGKASQKEGEAPFRLILHLADWKTSE